MSTTVAQARVDCRSLKAPQGYHWNIDSSLLSSQHQVQFSLSASDTPTKIYFKYDTQFSLFTETQWLDSDRRLMVHKPGRETWFPHPEQTQNIEAMFIALAKSMGFPIGNANYIQISANGDMTCSEIEDFITPLENMVSPTFYENIKSDVEKSVELTRQSLVKKILKASDQTSKTMSFLIKYGDVIQPIDMSILRQQVGLPPVEAKRIDAFTLLPLQELEKNQDAMLAELKQISQQQFFNPMDWFFKSQLPERTKLAILSLITHNHNSELFFVKGVIAKIGLRAGWEAFQHINKLYELETRFSVAESQGDLNKDIPVPCYNTDSYYSILRLHPASVAPAKRTYHFYGAFILARLLADLPLMNQNAAVVLTPAIGTAYGLLTYKNPEDAKALIAIYKNGAVCAWY